MKRALLLPFLLLTTYVHATYEEGRKAIENLTGCYLVDYNYAETKALKSGYVLDSIPYDATRSKGVKEWIYTEDVSSTRVRLQHVLFMTKPNGKVAPGTVLKHTGEDWEYNPSFIYDFQKPRTWGVKKVSGTDFWSRRITSLDDGLRYACTGQWTVSGIQYPEFNCAAYAPIPGRESRDKHRNDYHALERRNRIIDYGDSYLERQDNTKTIHDSRGKTPLVEETGKEWYVRLPDSECLDAEVVESESEEEQQDSQTENANKTQKLSEYVQARTQFWALLREAWDEVLAGDRDFIERPAVPGERYDKILKVEERYFEENLNDPKLRADVRNQLLKIISDYRAN